MPLCFNIYDEITNTFILFLLSLYFSLFPYVQISLSESKEFPFFLCVFKIVSFIGILLLRNFLLNLLEHLMNYWLLIAHLEKSVFNVSEIALWVIIFFIFNFNYYFYYYYSWQIVSGYYLAAVFWKILFFEIVSYFLVCQP